MHNLPGHKQYYNRRTGPVQHLQCVLSDKSAKISWCFQVRELQQQVSDQLQESNGSAAGQSSSRGRVEQLRRVVQQLQTHLRHARDIHGISMPLLDSDEGLLADFPEPSTEGTPTAVDSLILAVIAAVSSPAGNDPVQQRERMSANGCFCVLQWTLHRLKPTSSYTVRCSRS